MGPFRQILVPIDFGDAMQPAIALALTVAKGGEAQVTLLHAFDLNAFFAATSMTVAVDAGPILADLERELTSVRDATQARWSRVDSVFRTGGVADAILDVAKAKKCDLIVIGTHGRRGLAHVLLGSVAEKIVRLSPIPVLTVRPTHVEPPKTER
jgi:nucleotide-binding universal stress UspA family protein